MKKILSIFLLFTLVFGLASCGNNASSGNESVSSDNESVSSTNTNNDNSATLDKENNLLDYPKIDDIEWFFSNGVSYNEPAALFGYTNNTGFTIVELDIYFRLNDSVTAEQLAVFSGLKDSFSSLSDEELLKITPTVRDYMVCENGETVDGAVCYLKASYEAESISQCDLFTLDSATIAFIGNDGKKHTVAYSAANEGYSLVEKAEELFVWSESAYAKLVPQPDTKVATVDYDEADYFQFTAYDINSSGYAAYIEACKVAGFSNDLEESEFSFWGTDSQGHKMNVRFFPTMNSIEVTVKPK